MKNAFFLLLSIVGMVIVISFMLQNTSEIVVKILFWEIKSTISSTVVAISLIGILAAFFSLLPSILHRRKQLYTISTKSSEAPK